MKERKNDENERKEINENEQQSRRITFCSSNKILFEHR